jgi:hypothetical protein
VSPARAGGARRPAERELLIAVASELRGRGYRTYLDPDGTDYFDLAVRRDDEVGLVEGKVGRTSEVLGQALRRRAWGDWVAVALSSELSARRLIARTSGTRASTVGVWVAGRDGARELRGASRFPTDSPDDPFGPTRELLRRHLVALDQGGIPTDVRWSGVLAAVRRASSGRGFAEWRLDEPPQRAP